jgi:hypothetical protein
MNFSSLVWQDEYWLGAKKKKSSVASIKIAGAEQETDIFFEEFHCKPSQDETSHHSTLCLSGEGKETPKIYYSNLFICGYLQLVSQTHAL